jgi:FdhD protein
MTGAVTWWQYGAPILVGVGAPSSLAIELAADRRMTLAGFARRGNINVYAGAERVKG